MTRRTRFFITLALVLGLLVALLLWRVTRESEFMSTSSLVPLPDSPVSLAPSPLTLPTFTPSLSPLPVPPTAPPPITAATLEAIRATRPTATLPSSSGMRLPYISPTTWRGWALRILAIAGVLAYAGLRLRRGQKT